MSPSVDLFACCILTSNSQVIDSDLVVSCIISLDVFQTDFKVCLRYTLVNTKRFIKKSYQNITTLNLHCTKLSWFVRFGHQFKYFKIRQVSRVKVVNQWKNKMLMKEYIPFEGETTKICTKNVMAKRDYLILTETCRIPFRCSRWMP